MDSVTTAFYKSGGTLSPDEPCYVHRAADDELYDRLCDGEFCYVLTSRQMGKSSLMNRTAMRLSESGAAVAELDLTSIGQNLTLEQWYDGLVYEIGRRMRIRARLRDCWESNTHLGPLQRFLATLRDGVLTAGEQRVIIFIDEIEVVRSLPFSTDEFFAAIRECYNRRAGDPEMRRLTFCLFGMASPQELIRDTRITPFNIGRRIELTDFSEPEAALLISGMRNGNRDVSRLLHRVLYWTSGQPYLTQCLCEAIAGDSEVRVDRDVDRLCHQLFFTERARETERNLVPLREYVLRSTPDRAGLLDVYGKVLRGRRFFVDASDPLVATLQLSGLTHLVEGRLRVRNRIYARVFDKAWIRANMPDAELQRQRAAEVRVLARATAVYGAIIAATLYLAVFAFQKANLARRESLDYQRAALNAHELLYVADINLAQQALDRHDTAQVESLLNAHRGDPMAGFEYGYLWHMCHQELFECRYSSNYLYAAAFSPDADQFAIGGYGGGVQVWNRNRERLLSTLSPSHSEVDTLAYSPNGHYLVAGRLDGSIDVWNTSGFALVRHIITTGHVKSVAFSADGQWLGVAGTSDCVTLFDTRTWAPGLRLKGSREPVIAVAFSPNSHSLAAAGSDRTVRIWDYSTGQCLKVLPGFTAAVRAVAFSSDGGLLAAGGEDRTVRVWATDGWKNLQILNNEGAAVFAIAFAGQTHTLATAGEDNCVKLWDIPDQNVALSLDGQQSFVWGIACSRDGRWLASVSWDGTARIWDLQDIRKDVRVLPVGNQVLRHCSLSPDGLLAGADMQDDRLTIWDTSDLRLIGAVPRQSAVSTSVALFRNNVEIATWDRDAIRIYSLRSGNNLWAGTMPSRSDIFDVAASPDGRLIAAMDRAGRIAIWMPPASRPVRILQSDPDAHGGSLAFSPDDRLLAVGLDDSAVQILELQTGRCVAELRGHHAGVTAAAFTADGRTLATGSLDGTVKLWNLTTSRETLTLTVSRSGIRALIFVDHGKRLIVMSSDGALRTLQSTTNGMNETGA
ncbi:MAG: AAA-like domain-containing protein [Capsulimonadaceae bacterium]